MAFLADGRTRTNRRWLEEGLGSSMKDFMELWFIYTGKPSKGIIKSRKVAFASATRETAFMKLNFNRTKLSLKERTSFNAAGEADLHDTTFSGVLFPQKLPYMKLEDKQKVLSQSGALTEMIPARWEATGGAPLFWQESKSMELWGSLIDLWSAQAVVDLTPGSGTLAKACLSAGIPYLGFALDSTHQMWLENIATVHAMRIITTAGSVLHCQDLAEAIKSLYQDALDDPASDEEAEPEADHSEPDA